MRADTLVLGRFRIVRLLKEGQHIETFLAENIDDGNQYIIKRTPLHHLGNAARGRIMHETEALRHIESPWLIPNSLFAEEGSLFYLVRPFVTSITLEERLAQKPLSVRETLTLGQILMMALRTAHEHGVLHLDVKPANLIVAEGITVEGVILVDFSLPRRQSTETVHRNQPAGDIRYLSPESVGLLDQEITEAADLYSAGIVLYECLAGRTPFNGTISEVLHQHLSVAPPSLKTLDSALPRALEAVIEHLLHKDPRGRYQSAEGALADIKPITEALDRGIVEPLLVVGAHDRRRTLTEPAFVGRIKELDILDAEQQRAAQGHGGLVCIESESGGGKTRLLEEFSRRIAHRRVWILRGQGVDQGSTQRPFQVLAGIVGEVLSASRTDQSLPNKLRDRLGAYCEAVCDALPELAPLLSPGSTTSAHAPEALGEIRSLRAVTALLDAMGSEHIPAVVFLDDCRWDDDLSQKLIIHWAARPEAEVNTRRHVMLVVAFHSEEISPDHPLRAVVPSTRLVLPPLDAKDLQSLVESMAGQLPLEVITTVVQFSEGSPFMASAVLHGLVEAGALVPEPAGWKAEPKALAEARSSRQAAEFLTHRLRQLQPEVLELLSAAAVLGKEFELEFAESVAGLSPQEGHPLLREARRLHIIWSRQDRYSFVHDRLREMVLNLLPAPKRLQLHRRAAEILEATDQTRVFDLAYHYDAAGEAERAGRYALEAAEQARSQHSLEVAERYYRIAEGGARDADAATHLRIYLGLADVLTLRGLYREAPHWYEMARSFAADDLTRARIESKTGEVAFKSSGFDTAFQGCNAGLRLLRRKAPTRTAAFFVLFLWELVIHILHALLPGLFTARRNLNTPRAEADLLSVALYDRLIYLWYFARAGKIPAGWACLRALNLAETYPATVALGHAYSVLANIIAGGFPPLVFWSLRLRKKALAVQEALHTLHGRGQALVYCWPVSHAVTKFDEGIALAKEGRKLLVLAGDQWDLNASYWGVALCHLCKGDVHAAVEESQALHRLAREIGDYQNVGNALWVWSQASGGQVPKNLIAEALEQPDLFFTTRISLLGAEGIRCLGEGQPEAAIAPLDTACRLATGRGMVDTLIGDILSWHATALRLAATKTPPAAAQKREALLSRAEAGARQARLFGRVYPLLRPLALRESGLIAAARGHAGRARRFLDRAITIAEKQAMPLQHALALHARGEVGLAVGWTDAEADLATAEQRLYAMGVEPIMGQLRQEAPTLALIDRFAGLLEKGRTIVTMLSKEDAIAAVESAVLTLFHTEKVMVLEVISANGALAITPAGQNRGAFPRVLVEQAVRTGQPVIFSADFAGEADEVPAMSGVKSALCVPIFVRGSVVYCFYAAHHQVAGLFGEEEERLAGFIASMTGAALENAQNILDMESSHNAMQKELERRVAERTAELQVANRELEAFSYSVSHDLRAPLRSISGFSNILLEKYAPQLSPEVQRYLRIVREGADKMGQLIDDLLNFSRLSRQPLNKRLIEPAELVRRVLEDLRAEQEGRRCEIAIGDLPQCHADPALLRQVFVNLLANALKFTRHREVAHIEVGSRKEDDICVYFVKDNGAGFDMRYADKLFGAFQRLHRADEYEGTGVGLAVVQRVIHRHGGRVWAEAEKGKGATFYFTLEARNLS